MLRIFENPLVVIAIVVLILLLFAAPKLPAFAKSLGQSMRIFRKEVKTMKDEKAADEAETDPKADRVAGDPADDGKPSA